ncbi:MAG TPA: ABC-2 family transporter protein [Kofleriaceae bacterium]|nr:ABC-2 family transporter protein [Kofleriaceae bacterium]
MSAWRAFPTLLRVGVAETVAYRAEFLVWILTTTLPLVMLALWTTVANDGTSHDFRGYTSDRFVAYYLANLIVRNVTGSWVAWQISEEIRTGTMSMRLLRPLHPFVAFAASHIAAIPFRSVVALPIAAALLLSSGASSLATNPLQLALLLPSIALAWLVTFAILFAIGSLAFWITKSMALFTLYFGLYNLLSGYLLPIDLMPSWITKIAEYSPFPAMLASPVRLMTEQLDTGQALGLVAGQAGWAVAMIALALWMWNAGIRKFEAVGG